MEPNEYPDFTAKQLLRPWAYEQVTPPVTAHLTIGEREDYYQVHALFLDASHLPIANLRNVSVESMDWLVDNRYIHKTSISSDSSSFELEITPEGIERGMRP